MAEPGFREIGVVEGFYGRVWDAGERFRFIEALLPFGLNTYLLCPKHEPPLAHDVMGPLSCEERARLGDFAGFCVGKRVKPWAGLHLEPPLDVTNQAHLAAAAEKCRALADLGFSGFVLQFDDISADSEAARAFGGSLAALQAHASGKILQEARALGVAADWLVVPALYALDPILEKLYGPFEPDYLARLDEGLPGEVALIYSGPRVCAPAISLADLAEWRGNSRREVVLWDNYPVNDAAMVNNLHLSPLTGRAPELPSQIRGYLFNPLLQPALGVLPGATCLAYASNPAGYTGETGWREALAAFLPEEAAGAFTELEALTRRCCLVEFLTKAAFPAGAPLATRLEQAWAEGQKGATPPLELIEAFRDVLTTLDAHLPEAMKKEAAPWLERLGHAQAIFAARAKGGNSIQQEAAYQQYNEWVLGQWFQP